MKSKNNDPPIGGQALIEGVYMRGPKNGCIAVRRLDGELYIELSAIKRPPLGKLPFVRGAVIMVDSLIKGYYSIMKSADISMQGEEYEGKLDRWLEEKLGGKASMAIGAIAAVLGAVMSIMLFLVLPTFIAGLLKDVLAAAWLKAAVEGVLKIVIFVAYLFLVTRLKDIRRVFEYHGAEHKAIACFEAKEELTVENVKRHRRFHPRCGTSFIFLVLIVSIAIFSFVPFENTFARAGAKLLLVPVIMGIAYEGLRFAGRNSGVLAKILGAPGMWIQRLTALEPDEAQLEVAIAALKGVIPEEGQHVGEKQ